MKARSARYLLVSCGEIVRTSQPLLREARGKEKKKNSGMKLLLRRDGLRSFVASACALSALADSRSAG
jgi:hypothetical protein